MDRDSVRHRDSEPHGGGDVPQHDAWRLVPGRAPVNEDAVINREWDEQVRHQMADVTVPVGLRDRLHRAIQMQESTARDAESAAAGPAKRSAGRFLRLRLACTAVCVVLVVAAGLWLWPTAPQLRLADVTDVAIAAELPASPDEVPYAMALPAGWRDVFSLSPELIRPCRVANGLGSAAIGVVPFRFHARRSGEVIRGRLLAVPFDWFVDASLTEGRFVTAEVFYRDRLRAWSVWREGSYVYVCSVLTGPQNIHRLQADMREARSVM